MSRLDDIFLNVYAGSSDEDGVTSAKKEVKILFIELIEATEHKVGKCERLKQLVKEVNKL